MLDSDGLQSMCSLNESVLLWMTIQSGEAVSQVREMKFLERSFDKDADSASSVAFLLWYMIQMLLNDERAEARRALAGRILVLCVRLSVCVTNTGLIKRRR